MAETEPESPRLRPDENVETQTATESEPEETEFECELSAEERNLLETIRVVTRHEIGLWAERQAPIAKAPASGAAPTALSVPAMMGVGGPLLLMLLSSLLQSGVPQELLQTGVKKLYESLKNQCALTGSLDAPSEEPVAEPVEQSASSS